jgi:hypothetical protein
MSSRRIDRTFCYPDLFCMKISRQALLLVLVACVMFSACATLGPPEPPSLQLPKPPSDLQAKRKGDKVTLTWTIPTKTTDRQTVRSLGPTRICRALQSALTECGKAVGQEMPARTAASAADKQAGKPSGKKKKPEASYIDTLPTESDDPSEFITYAVEVVNADGRGAGISNQVRVSVVRTLPAPFDFHAHVTSQGVVLSWTGKATPASRPNVRYVYRAYRRLENGHEENLIGEIPAGNEQNFSVTDPTIEWEKTYEYRAEAVTVLLQADKSELQIEGDNSSEIKVYADDVFPPAVPSGVQAAFSGPGQEPFIDLIWAPDSDADLAGYNVYRHEEGTAPAKINAVLVKTPAYRDRDVVPGESYSYSVSAVDLRGNESARSEEATEAVH